MNKLDLKNIVENIKHLKIQHLFDSPKKYSSYNQQAYPKEYGFRNSKLKKYSFCTQERYLRTEGFLEGLFMVS